MVHAAFRLLHLFFLHEFVKWKGINLIAFGPELNYNTIQSVCIVY